MIIKNALVFVDDNFQNLDIEVREEKISKISKNIESSNYIDAKGAYLIPGIIDLNVSLKDNIISKENINSLSNDSLQGGVTSLIVDSNTSQAIDNEFSLEYFKSMSKSVKGARLSCSVLGTSDGLTMNNIAILYKNGTKAVYLNSSANNNIIRRIFEYHKMYEKVLFCGVRDKSLSSDGVMNEGEISYSLGLSGLSPLAEIIHITKIIEMAKFFNISVLFKTISTIRGLELIKRAKEEGVKAYCEVSIHHLSKTEEECMGYNTYAKISPPLRSKETVRGLKKLISVIDVLTSLHSPASKIKKEVSFNDAFYGTESIKDIMSIYYTYLVKEAVIDFKDLISLISRNPAKILGLNNGLIKEGYFADFILFNPKKTYTIKNSNSLYNKEKVFGKVEKVFIRGKEKL